MHLTALLPALFVAASAQAVQLDQPPPDKFFTNNRTFRCELGYGEGRYFVGEQVEDRKGDKFSEEIIFDNVDYEKRTVRVIGNLGAEDATVIDGPLAVSFLERTLYGGIVVTTIDKRPLGIAQYRTSMSRHIPNTIGGYTASQYYGECRGQL